jgi:PAS domain S-box-containing protein
MPLQDNKTTRPPQETAPEHEEWFLQANQLMEAVTKGTNVIIAAQDLDLRYTFFNTTYAAEIKRLTGKVIRIGSKMAELFADQPDQLAFAEREWREVLAGNTTNKQLEFGDPGRHQRIYRVLHTPIRDTNDQVVGAVEVAYDITAQAHAEEALREGKERERARAAELAAVLDAVPTPVFIAYDPACVHITGNRAADEMLRNPRGGEASLGAPEEVRPRHFKAVVGGRELPIEELPAQRAARGERVRDFEFSFIFDDGTVRHMVGNGVPLRDKEGRPWGSVLVLTDITERKQAEEVLRESEERFRALFEGNTDGMLVADPQNKVFVMGNPAICRMLGCRPEEIPTMRLAEIHRQEDMPFVLDHFERLVSGRESTGEDVPVKRKDGSVFFADVTVNPIILSGKTYVVGSFRDITERKRAEETLHKNEARFKLLSDTAGRLLTTDNPQGVVNELCRNVMAHLDCQVFFNFLVDDDAGWLRLNACAGIPEEEARKIERLDYGVAVCGCVARDGSRIVAEDIFNIPDPRTELVKSFGIQAYACHPLKVEGRLIGTLSFGTKTRTSFSPDDLALMKTVTDQVATAMERMGLIKELRRSRDELEIRVQERTEELAKSQERLQNLASQLLLAQEKERKRVAVELHDSLMSELAATKFLLEAKIKTLDNGKAIKPGELRRIADVLASTMKEARRIMNNLHPSLLDELGLIATIRWLCGEFQKSYPHIAVQQGILVSEEDISRGIRVVIYRILQEALNNFARHGNGDRVEVSLSKSDGAFALVIRDNGQGFDVGNAGKGLGLESMRERVDLSGGEFQIESILGQGTTIRAIWSSS